MNIYKLTKEERDRISGIHNLNESSERDNAWKTLVNDISYNTVYIKRLLSDYKVDKVTNVEDVILKSKRFMYDRLKSGYFNKILIDGSGGTDFAVEVSNFIIKEVTSIVNSINGIVFLPIREKDVDREISKIDFDYIFTDLDSFFNYGGYFTTNNIDPYIDKGFRFYKDFNKKFEELSPRIKEKIVQVIKSRV